jgi:hypothetical protein
MYKRTADAYAEELANNIPTLAQGIHDQVAIDQKLTAFTRTNVAPPNPAYDQLVTRGNEALSRRAFATLCRRRVRVGLLVHGGL